MIWLSDMSILYDPHRGKAFLMGALSGQKESRPLIIFLLVLAVAAAILWLIVELRRLRLYEKNRAKLRRFIEDGEPSLQFSLLCYDHFFVYSP